MSAVTTKTEPTVLWPSVGGAFLADSRIAELTGDCPPPTLPASIEKVTMFLDYLSLAILLMGLTLVFYTFIYIHDIPYQIAKQRHHPHEEAIHVAGWLSLFTLHAIWPIVFIWAVSHQQKPEGTHATDGTHADQSGRIAALEARLRKLETSN